MQEFSGVKQGTLHLKQAAAETVSKSLQGCVPSSCSGPAFHRLPQHGQFPPSV